ncbi:S41 family peptidase [Candidatus Neomarinimicrobiota bacterium]
MAFKTKPGIGSGLVTGALLLTLGCGDRLVDSKSSETNLADFESTWEFVQQVYPYFELKGVHWDTVYAQYQPIAAESRGDEIFTVLVDMLGELKDGHIYLKTIGGHKIATHIPGRRIKDQYAYSPEVVRKYFNEDLRVMAIGGMEFGLTEDNLGYIYISSFGSALNFKGNFQAAINHTMASDGLIIDVRHNTGGDGINAVYVVSRFLTDHLENLDTYVLGELKHSTPIQPSSEQRYGGPVVVLINGVCYSATESFAEMMKQIPTVTVMGDTTGGGSAGYYGMDFPASGDLRLESGMLVHVGTIDIRRYDDLPFEDIGIGPDLLVPQTESDIATGRDLQLEAALSLLGG